MSIQHMMKETFPAKIDVLPGVLDFVECSMELYGCPMKIQRAICVVTIVLYLISIAIGIFDIANGMPLDISLDMFSKATDIIMIFLFTFFAYDSAKAQLKKVTFSK